MVTDKPLFCSRRLKEVFLCKIYIYSIIFVRFQGNEWFFDFLKDGRGTFRWSCGQYDNKEEVIVCILNVGIRLASSFLSPSCHVCCFFVVGGVAPCESKAFLEVFAIIWEHTNCFQLAGFANNLAQYLIELRVKVGCDRSCPQRYWQIHSWRV